MLLHTVKYGKTYLLSVSKSLVLTAAFTQAASPVSQPENLVSFLPGGRILITKETLENLCLAYTQKDREGTLLYHIGLRKK